jgi:crotonobetainyl-CoA:carnitine CoA-transferase CaiB-like acyl-CoA transferase
MSVAAFDPALPFKGLKVIDCASFIAGPAAATMLGDFGADVIKIEPPEGDAYRELFRLAGLPNTGPNYHGTNYPWALDSRNKKSLVLDLKQAEGQAVLYRMLGDCDVFITNLPLPVRRRLNLTFEQLGPLNPKMIYASFTAYGECGPEADKTGFDATAYWARSGLMDTVRSDSTTPPARSIAGMGDHPSASALFGAITTALYRRERSGLGGLVTSSLLANGLWANGFFVQAHLSGAQIPVRPPRTQVVNPLSNIYRCQDDRWLNLVIINAVREFEPLLKVLGCAQLAQDERFHSPQARAIHHAALIEIFDRQFATQPLASWRRQLDAAGITFGVIGTLSDIDSDVQMRESGALVPFADGTGWTVASPFTLGGAPHRAPGAAPELGQHSHAVLRDEGFNDHDIERLRALKIIGA